MYSRHVVKKCCKWPSNSSPAVWFSAQNQNSQCPPIPCSTSLLWKVVQACQLRLWGEDVAQICTLTEVQHAVIFCARGGGNTVVAADGVSVAVIANKWPSSTSGKACCAHLAERHAWWKVLNMGNSLCSLGEWSSHTVSYYKFKSLSQFLQFSAEHVFPLPFYINTKRFLACRCNVAGTTGSGWCMLAPDSESVQWWQVCGGPWCTDC